MQPEQRRESNYFFGEWKSYSNKCCSSIRILPLDDALLFEVESDLFGGAIAPTIFSSPN